MTSTSQEYLVGFEAKMQVTVQHDGDDRPSSHELTDALREAMRAGNVAEDIDVYKCEKAS